MYKKHLSMAMNTFLNDQDLQVIPKFCLLSSIAQVIVLCAFFSPDLLLEVSTKIKGCEFVFLLMRFLCFN